MLNPSKFFKEKEDDAEFKFYAEQLKNYIDRLLAEKIVKTQDATPAQLKSLLAYASVNIHVVGKKLMKHFPDRASEIESAIFLISTHMSILFAGVIVTMIDTDHAEREEIKTSEGTWHDKPDYNSN